MKTPIYIIVGILAVLALLIYFLVAPSSVSISDNTQAEIFGSEESITTNENTTMQLQITDEVVGTGDPVKTGDTVSVHYRGTLEDGTEFDASYNRNQPFSFTVGEGSVIQGWEQGLIGMQVGGKRKLVIPSELGYGSTGAGGGLIPPDATLLFEIELLEIK